LGEGTHLRLYDVMGAHVRTFDGVSGTAFALWAPNARRVSVVGDFNDWDGNRHRMWLRRDCGVWELFIPGVGAGARYKYELEDNAGHLLPLRVDPIAFYAEQRPRNASIVWDAPAYPWSDAAWLAGRAARQHRDAPISIYEVHLGSWRRVPEDGNRFLTYRELADTLVPYVRDLGFTHIELMPITEHPFDGSWGYQTTGWFAPTSRFGTPDDARAFIEAAHNAGLGVIVDWVPGHFPTDDFSLGKFDGTSLYEHADPRKGFHKEWGTYAFNLGRTEVANILLASALYWLREFHVDGLRVDAVSSIIYLDYDREDGQWIPNIYGGNENLDSTGFLRRFNTIVYGEFPDVMTIAEESTAYAGVTTPVSHGGLGFGFKWNMGWMHDTLEFMKRDPLYRSHHLNEISFGLIYAFSENFVLPLSHDEVVHGKGSLYAKMAGDHWQKLANLRALYAYMWAHPGKKLLFMGGELAQGAEWSHERSLDWHLLQSLDHAGIQSLVRDLNRLYRALPALYERDCEPSGFRWLEPNGADANVLAFARFGADRDSVVVFAVNLSPVPRSGYRLGVPGPGRWREALNTDSAYYGGSDMGNLGGVTAEPLPWHDQPFSVRLTLPPLAAVFLVPDDG
jgi:1,4-alpha-glucan branching enzyme